MPIYMQLAKLPKHLCSFFVLHRALDGLYVSSVDSLYSDRDHILICIHPLDISGKTRCYVRASEGESRPYSSRWRMELQ
jgi:hypothetical protein